MSFSWHVELLPRDWPVPLLRYQVIPGGSAGSRRARNTSAGYQGHRTQHVIFSPAASSALVCQ